MYRQNQSLVDLLSPVIRAMGYEMLGLEHHSGRKTSLLRIYIDKENGIGLDDCTRVNRQVEALLDVHEPLAGSYQLEVSSPGLDRPLFTLAQFARFIDHRVQVRTREYIDGRHNFTGRITAVEDGAVRLATHDGAFTLTGDSIGWARLAPDTR